MFFHTRCLLIVCTLWLNVMFCVWFPSRWSGLKKGWRRKRASLRSSRGWSTVANRCKHLPITPFQLVVVHSGKSGNKESRHYDLYCIFASKLSVDKIDDINANSFSVGLQRNNRKWKWCHTNRDWLVCLISVTWSLSSGLSCIFKPTWQWPQVSEVATHFL